MKKEDLPERVRRYRKEHHMTIQHFADVAGVSVNTVSDLEKRKRNLGTVTRVIIESFLDGIELPAEFWRGEDLGCIRKN